MPRYYVGLDFGTHQTKVCVKDTKTNPQSYQFIEFETPERNNKLMIPSVVQVNKDDTVSYGFVNETFCKDDTFVGEYNETFDLEEPRLELPPKPIEVRNKNKILASLADLKQVLSRKSNATPYKLELKRWEDECNELKNEYDQQMESWQEEKDFFMEGYEKWKSSTTRNFIMRYFKLATFNKDYGKVYSSKHTITQEKTSILYLTYILFCIEDCIGNDFFVQMGIPSGKDRREFERQSAIANRILISANELKKQYHSKHEYLKRSYEELLNFTPSKDERNVEQYEMGLQAIPEAYAGLSAIVRSGRLSSGGIHMHIDIGGGTTDISLFSLGDKGDDAEIYSVTSFHKGLNFIIENTDIDGNMSNDEKHKRFNNSKGDDAIFRNSIYVYLRELDKHLIQLISELKDSFNKAVQANISKSALYAAILYQPRVYCGGGSLYKNLINSEIKHFLNKKVLTKDDVAPYVKFTNKNLEIERIFTILVVAYGLAERVVFNKNPQTGTLDDLFSHLKISVDLNQNGNKWNERYDRQNQDD